MHTMHTMHTRVMVRVQSGVGMINANPPAFYFPASASATVNQPRS